MLKKSDLLKGLIWVTFLAIFDQVLFFLVYQLALGGGVKITLGEGLRASMWFYPIIVKAISFFLMTQIFLYGSLIFLVWFCCQQLRVLFPWFEKRLYWMGNLLLILCFVFIFISNLIYFPNSFFSYWLTQRTDYFQVYFPFIIRSEFILAILLGTILIGSFLQSIRKFFYDRVLLKIITLISLISIFVFIKVAFAGVIEHRKPAVSPVFDQPNIIIIGLDAVRPDYLGFNGKNKRNLTPNLDRFMKNAVVFDDALTPLARTFPAWVSILTGTHPKHHGARFNLDNPQILKIDFSLPKFLQTKGYETWFATDETRFSNIDASFGFDHMLIPKTGVNDFLLGTLNDFPINNVLINSWLGEKLFPYNYANRGAFVTYEPALFVKKINHALPYQSQLKKPLFLSMHLLISHWPNEWATSHFSKDSLLTERYDASLQAIDLQWNQVMTMLENKNLLNNAIIIVLSDHGESLGMRGDRLLNEKNHMPGHDDIKEMQREIYVTSPEGAMNFEREYGIDTSYGHGTDVLSLSQYQTVMAWQQRGSAVWQPHRVETRVSLLDIAPTLMTLLHFPLSPILEGESLTSFLKKETKEINSREFYVENGYKVPAVESAHIEVSKVLEQSLRAYEINSVTGKVTMRMDISKAVIPIKQYAVFNQQWLLASYPPYEKDAKQVASIESKKNRKWFIVNLKTHQWSSDLTSSWAKQTPALQLKKKLLAYYGEDISD